MKQVIIFLLMGYNNEVPVQQLQNDINSFYSINVQVKYDKMPEQAYYKPRNRYRADSILNYLSRKYPNKRVIALTSYDISTTSNGYADWGVFGLGSLSENVCITSTYRLKNKNLAERLLKVMLHEVGHSYGLPHCTSGHPCFMHECTNHTAAFIDKEPMIMCDVCKRKKLKNYAKMD